MKKLLYLLFLTLAAGIVCAQQRISDIRPGEPCAGILELEKRLGSLALPDQAESGISRFSGNQGGKDAEIEYHCEEGSLTEQRIRVLFPTREEAYRFAREQRALVGLCLAYFGFRKKLPLTLRSALYPVLGDRIYGPIGHAVDLLAVFGTVFGVATSLGLGVSQMATGLNVLLGVDPGTTTQIARARWQRDIRRCHRRVGYQQGVRCRLWGGRRRL